MTAKEINEEFKKNNDYNYHNGIIIDEVSDEKVIAHIDAKDYSLNSWKIMHGGIIFGLADIACGVLCYSKGHKCVTIDSNINYLKPVKKYAKAVATCTKSGNTISLYKAEIFNEKEEMCATVTMNYYNLDKEE